MKKVLALICAVLLIFCSCSSRGETPEIKTADMLEISNTDMDFQGGRSRFESVVSAMKSKVSILENAHNNHIKTNAENEYFLERDYVLTAFEPFIMSDFSVTAHFNSDLTAETAKDIYEHERNGMDIILDSDGKSKFDLQMISEILVKNYSVEYNEKTDSFRYIYTLEDSNSEEIQEFLEFISHEDGAYIIQTNKSRCYIEFDDEDNIVYFCCGELMNGEFNIDESLFEQKKIELSKNWVLARGKSNYSNIHTYDSGILTHEDCSSGPWKSVKINESDYASAFYAG
ncbi:MAG: hypothetical protein IJE74_04230 [Clostridia bacterium]|nr:hypothetical protein [Clostridia bacterium]